MEYQGLDAIHQTLRQALLVSATSIGGGQACTIHPSSWSTKLPFPDYWYAGIFLLCPEVQVTLKIFYNTRLAKGFLTDALNFLEDARRQDFVHDIFRELCNMAAGHTKRNLMGQIGEFGLSLPYVSRGFDEIFSTGCSQIGEHEQRFSIVDSRENRLNIVTRTVVLDSTCVAKIRWDSADNDYSDAQTEFL